MTLERSRRLINGVWQYVTAPDGGGGPGSTPNLATVLAEGADAGGAGITGLDDPTADQDAATKKYVDDNGGSVPGTVRLLDLGVVNTVDVLTGPVTLYTPEAGEIVGPILLADVVLQDVGSVSIAITRDEEDDSDPFLGPMAGWDNDTAWDGLWGAAVGSGVDGNLTSPVTTGAVKAECKSGLPPSTTVRPWQANHGYDGSAANAFAIGSDGHVWTTSDTGTSGATEPDFAGNEGGSVLDNDITWADNGALPASGSVHVYAYSSVPVVP